MLDFLRLGTRSSLLAMRQSEIIAEALRARHPGLRVELVPVTTSGDRLKDMPLYDAGGKGLFVRELEQALLAGAIDFAVHSYKDMPIAPEEVSDKLVIAATPARHDPRDLLVSRQASSIEELPAGASIGTGSLRRRCQLLARRPDLRIEPMRGNIDTRLRKLNGGDCDAIILAMAGVARAGLMDDAWMFPVPVNTLLPAAGQGVLAVQARGGDAETIAILSSLDDPTTRMCVDAERAVVAALSGDCHSPIGVLAEMEGEAMSLRAMVGGRDGKPPVIEAVARAAPALAIMNVCDSLLARGAAEMLRGR